MKLFFQRVSRSFQCKMEEKDASFFVNYVTKMYGMNSNEISSKFTLYDSNNKIKINEWHNFMKYFKDTYFFNTKDRSKQIFVLNSLANMTILYSEFIVENLKFSDFKFEVNCDPDFASLLLYCCAMLKCFNLHFLTSLINSILHLIFTGIEFSSNANKLLLNALT